MTLRIRSQSNFIHLCRLGGHCRGRTAVTVAQKNGYPPLGVIHISSHPQNQSHRSWVRHSPQLCVYDELAMVMWKFLSAKLFASINSQVTVSRNPIDIKIVPLLCHHGTTGVAIALGRENQDPGTSCPMLSIATFTVFLPLAVHYCDPY